jgi:hypothetical protein
MYDLPMATTFPIDSFAAVSIKVRALIAEHGIPTDVERVETLITNFHSDPASVTLQVVRRAARKINRFTTED